MNPYRKISFNNLEFKLSGVSVRDVIQLCIVPNKETGMADIRFWCENELIGIQNVRLQDIKLVHF